MFEAWSVGLHHLLIPQNLLMVPIGAAVGLLAGMLPGLDAMTLAALLLPFTYYLDTSQSLLLLASVYSAGTYGGATTAILFRTPGAPENAPTSFDGYEMTLKGQAGRALGTAITCSAVGGVLSTVALSVLAPQIAGIALAFGAPEFFGLAVFGLSVVTSLGAASAVKGWLSALLGIFLGSIGISEMTGLPRYTFGRPELSTGLHFVPVMIGIFAASEVLARSRTILAGTARAPKVTTELPSLVELLAIKWTIVRSFLIGLVIGTIPGPGTTVASIVSYNEAVRWSRRPERFGTGILEGIAAPEVANNAAVGGALVPLLALGIPGSATAALMLSAFQIHGLAPGPALFTTQGPLVYTVFAGLFAANVFMVIWGLMGVRVAVQVLRIPYVVLAPAILLLCVIGSYAIRNNLFDVWVMLASGVVGYSMKTYGYSFPALVLGLILGPIAERAFLVSMMLSDNDPMVFVSRPISAALLALAACSFLLPVLRQLRARRTQGLARAGADAAAR